jgi:hypothetical protein
MHKKFGLGILKKIPLGIPWHGWTENAKMCLGSRAGDCTPN